MRLTYALLGAAIVAFATTGFECASSEMTAAKVDFNAHRYDKARLSLETEVRRNPKNEEAWYYLALTAHEQHDHVRVADACDSADLAGSSYKPKLSALRQAEWVESWNSAVVLFNRGGENKDSLRLAASLFKIAYRFDPQNSEPVRLLGATYLALGDTVPALESYLNYIAGTDATVKKGLDAGLVLGQTKDQVAKDLGAPESEQVMPTVDSTLRLNYSSKGLHVFLSPTPGEPGGVRRVIGWSISSGKSKDAPQRIEQLTAEPYRMVGNIYYQRGIGKIHEFENHPTPDSALFRSGVSGLNDALPYFTTAQRLNPSDEFASTMLSEVYLRTNQAVKASEAYQDLIRRFPSNKYSRLNYGVLLLKSGNYEEAIKQFESAQQIDPSYRLAQYYLAISYKNWSADIQASVRKNGGKETPEGKEKYLSILRKAAVYFDKMRQSDPNDFQPLGQLAEIYAILKDADNLKLTLSQLEKMESAQSDNAEYWDTLGKIYTVLNDVPKAKAAFAKSEALAHK